MLSILTTIITIKKNREKIKTLQFFMSINLWMFSILQNHQFLSCYFLSKSGCHSTRVWHWQHSVKPGVCRKSSGHFSDDHQQAPLGYHWIPGLSGSISPSDEKKESRGTRCSEVCCSCPLRLTRVTHLPWFSTTAKKPSMQGMKYLLGKGVCEFWKCLSVCTIASKGLR